MARPDLSQLTPITKLAGDTLDETREMQELARRASEFLGEFRWCRSVRACYAGIAIPGVVGVFLMQIEPAEAGVDEWLWVVVGDLPPAYIITDDAPSPPAALESYIGEMRAWVEAVRLGQPIEELIPVNVPPTPAYATMLDSRLSFLEANVLADDEERPPA